MNKTVYRILLMTLLLVLIFIADILLGSVTIPLSDFFEYLKGNNWSHPSYEAIIFEYRLPKALTACFAGSALAVSGLLMQSFFRNPLAGPYVLGISSGASLGVALLLLLFSGGFLLSVPLAACIGSLFVLIIMIWASKRFRSSVSLLILGLMISYLTGALVGVLQYFSRSEEIQSFVLWGLGSFAKTQWLDLQIMLPVLVLGLVFAYSRSKALNSLLLGESYAQSLGVSVKSIRRQLLYLVGILVAWVTAYCGPIAFLGMAVPHLVRLWVEESDHKITIPLVALTGACIALLCDMIAQVPGFDMVLPINSITSLFGAPFVIYYLLKKNRLG
ncbi:MAG: iron ABC transporter permease [Flavobacteriales bacterium]|nr:iron ABC transporter permease [Flavobacteriales bacterium]